MPQAAMAEVARSIVARTGLFVVAVLVLAGCAGLATAPPVTLPITVSVAPATASVQAGQQQQFTATVANTPNTAVTWQVNGVVGGDAAHGMISTSGLYAAPASVPNPASITVRAVSQADTAKSASATLTITAAVSVSVTPTTANVIAGRAQQFTATVSNATNTAVTWQVNGVTGGDAAHGTISTSGLYAAPASVPNPATVTIMVVSQADNTKSASTTVTISAAIAVSIAPTAANVNVGLSKQFSATVSNSANTSVTWQVNGVTGGDAPHGTISASGLYVAPASVPNPAAVTVTAVSQADSSKSASATVTVLPAISVSVAPPSATVNVNQAVNLSATVSNDSAAHGVTWSLAGAGCSGAACGTFSGATTSAVTYAAPASAPNPATVNIKATSVTDPTRSFTAVLTIAVPPPISVSVSPSITSIQTGKAQAFTATVVNDSTSSGVSWTLSGAGCSGPACGTVSSSTSASGVAITYMAPATVPSPAAVTLTATSRADGTKGASASITITAVPVVSVSVSPTSKSLQANLGSQSFTASVTNDTGSAGVTWALSGTGCSGAACGTLSSVTTTSVLYAAPAAAPTLNTVTLTATSIADTSKSASAIVTITPAVTISVAPTAATLNVTKTQQFTATISNSANTAVTWQVNGVIGGDATHGTISTSGLYATPASVPSPAAVTVTAVSQADASKSASSTATILSAITISVAPSAPSVQVSLVQNFTATISNDSANLGVTWSLSGSGCSGTTCGALSGSTSTAVTYTAPATVPSPATVTLTATSAADGTKTATATITVASPPVIVITLAPSSSNVQAGIGTQNFTASLTNDIGSKGVNWFLSGAGCSGSTCGALSNITTTSVTYAAPANVPSPATVTLTATSIADNSKTSTATITVTSPVSVSVAPTTAGIPVGQPQNFTATVSNDSQNKGVTWFLSGTGCSGAACGTVSPTSSASGVAVTYTAPATVPSPATVTLKATSVADGARSASATITIAPVTSAISVSITPVRGGLTVGQSLALTATVTNDVGTAGVTWTVSGGTLSNPTTTAATYVAPNTAGVYTITATSVANGTKNAAAAIGVTDLVGMFTYHNNISRDGANTQEYALTPSNVNTASFGKLFSCSVDAHVYAQPLWVANFSIGSTKHNMIIAATQHNTVYAFDADANPCVTLWSKSLTPSGETWGSSTDVACDDLAPAIGIVGTPVIDPSTNTLYVVSKTKTSNTLSYHQRLHALDLATGAEKFGGPTDISATVNSHSLDPIRNNQRPGLALVNGTIYIAWASHCDQGSYRGWVIAYSASTLAQTAVFTPAPHATTSQESGIWMSGGAPAADGSNNLYLITGNGTFDANSTTAPNDDYGDSFLKLSTTSGISVADYFAPNDQASLQTGDKDLGAGGAAILVDQPMGPVQHLVIGGGKEGILYLLNRDNLGKFTSTNSGAIQQVNVGDAIFATPAFWQNRLYIGGALNGGHVQSFTFVPSTGLFTTPSASISPTSLGFPGASPSVSAAGANAASGIVWALDSSKNGTGASSLGPAVLHAYDATNLANEFWNSSQGSGNAAGNAVKFTVPTIANGKVYVGTQTEITVYGLKPN